MYSESIPPQNARMSEIRLPLIDNNSSIFLVRLAVFIEPSYVTVPYHVYTCMRMARSHYSIFVLILLPMPAIAGWRRRCIAIYTAKYRMLSFIIHETLVRFRRSLNCLLPFSLSTTRRKREKFRIRFQTHSCALLSWVSTVCSRRALLLKHSQHSQALIFVASALFSHSDKEFGCMRTHDTLLRAFSDIGNSTLRS